MGSGRFSLFYSSTDWVDAMKVIPFIEYHEQLSNPLFLESLVLSSHRFYIITRFVIFPHSYSDILWCFAWVSLCGRTYLRFRSRVPEIQFCFLSKRLKIYLVCCLILDFLSYVMLGAEEKGRCTSLLKMIFDWRGDQLTCLFCR